MSNYKDWLDSICVPVRERRIYFPGAKYPIQVDGYDPVTNTVYEFLGDRVHGNLNRFHKDEPGYPNYKKTIAELNKEWLKRKKALEKLGYTVVFMWEYDYRESRKTSKMAA